jgi:hypothetical protein
VALAAAAACSSGSSLEPGTHLSMRTEKSAYHRGDLVHITVRNLSSERINRPCGPVLQRRLGGQWVRVAHEGLACLGILVWMEPGEEITLAADYLSPVTIPWGLYRFEFQGLYTESGTSLPLADRVTNSFLVN